jgi:hypothetical protein
MRLFVDSFIWLIEVHKFKEKVLVLIAKIILKNKKPT